MDGLAWRMRGPLQEAGLTGKTPVLKSKVQSWLIQKQEVLAFVQARPAHGGAGALVVLLAQSEPYSVFRSSWHST